MTMIGKLTAKQAEFIRQYLVDLNATQAAIRAGYSKRTAKEIGTENLSKPAISAAIAEAMEERSRRTEVTADRVLQELARIGFADARKLFDANGALKSLDQIDDDTRGALVIEVTEGTDDEGNPTFSRKLKLMCKLTALERLGKHLGLFRDRLEVSGDRANPMTLLIQSIQGSSIRPVEERIDGGEEYRRVASCSA